MDLIYVFLMMSDVEHEVPFICKFFIFFHVFLFMYLLHLFFNSRNIVDGAQQSFSQCVPTPASRSLGHLLKMHIFRHHSSPRESESLEVGPSRSPVYQSLRTIGLQEWHSPITGFHIKCELEK